MGKHGGVAARRQVSIRAVALAVLILAGVISVSWWWSLRTQPDPIDQNPVVAQAFVVSSPSCADSGTGTVVDVLPASGGQARAVINGCGYPNGHQLTVEYLAGDPSLARLAGTTAAPDADTIRQWWPIVLGVLVLLAAGLALVFLVDGRRSRTAPGSSATSPHASRTGRTRARHAQDESVDDQESEPAPVFGGEPIPPLTAMLSTTADQDPPSLTAAGVATRRRGRHALRELDDDQPTADRPTGDQPADDEPADDQPTADWPAGDGWLLNPDRGGWLPEPSWAAEISVSGNEPQPRDVEPAPVRLDLVFPSTAELAASLQDELFTHRHAQVSGG